MPRASDKVPAGSRVQGLIDATVDEIKGFLAVVFNMGLVKLPEMSDYWSKKDNLTQPWFRRMFTDSRSCSNFFTL